MSGIGRNDVIHVSRLAALEVPEAELEALVTQLQRIVQMVEQLNEIPAVKDAPAFHAGPSEAELRDDVVTPESLAYPLAEMAPGFVSGFFAVPRHTAMEEA